jgi:hypothetical protein
MNGLKVLLVGPFPPPVYGLSAVNGSVAEKLRQANIDLRIINLAAPNLSRGLLTRFKRLFKVMRGLLEFGTQGGSHGQVLYSSVSDGLGQFYELFFVCLARIRGMWVVLHHHSFAYLNARNFITQALIKCAGSSSIQIALSPQMAKRLQVLYGATQVVSISNAVFLLGNETPQVRLRGKASSNFWN